MSRQFPMHLKLELEHDEKTKERLKYLQDSTGIASLTDIARFCISQEYTRRVGTPSPSRPI